MCAIPKATWDVLHRNGGKLDIGSLTFSLTMSHKKSNLTESSFEILFNDYIIHMVAYFTVMLTSPLNQYKCYVDK